MLVRPASTGRPTVLGRSRDDERRARLVDQDGVDLVDDRVVQLALHVVLEPQLHVVAQVVEAELVVRAVGDVGAVDSPSARSAGRSETSRHGCRPTRARGTGRCVPSTRRRGGPGSR